MAATRLPQKHLIPAKGAFYYLWLVDWCASSLQLLSPGTPSTHHVSTHLRSCNRRTARLHLDQRTCSRRRGKSTRRRQPPCYSEARNALCGAAAFRDQDCWGATMPLPVPRHPARAAAAGPSVWNPAGTVSSGGRAGSSTSRPRSRITRPWSHVPSSVRGGRPACLRLSDERERRR